MWMTAASNPDRQPETKAGSALSAANHAILKKAMDGIETSVKDHVKSVRGMMSVAQRANDLQGYPVYSASSADPALSQKEEDVTSEEDAAPATLPDMHSILDDLTNVLNAQNAFRGV